MLTRDELLDNVMFYWATEQRGAARPASTGRASARRGERSCRVPVGVTVYPKEIVAPVRSWMEARLPEHRALVASSRKGGHFAAFEQPELFVDEVRTCFRQFR